MPFTFAHPAIVLPFNYVHKRYISFAGLVAGSMVPDFDYFLSMKKGNIFKSHTWPGLLWFDLPVGLVLLFIFYGVVRKPLFQHLPKILKARVWQFREFNWTAYFKTKWPIVILSILFGAVLHILWDKLTHESIHFMDEVMTISDVKASANYRNPYYFLSWNLNSLLGLLAIAFTFWKSKADNNVPYNRRTPAFWLMIAGLASLIFFGRVYEENNLGISDYVVSAIAAFLFALILTSIGQVLPKCRE